VPNAHHAGQLRGLGRLSANLAHRGEPGPPGLARRATQLSCVVPNVSADRLSPDGQHLVRLGCQFWRRTHQSAPLGLAEEVQLFDCVRCRYDGSQFWFDERDMRHDPGTSAYLRAALADQTSPQDLERHGLTAEERAAYELNYWQLVQPPDADDDVNEPAPNALHRRRSKRPRPGEPAPFDSDPVRRRLRENLSHAGARLVDYLERGDSFRVRYRVAGHEYTSSVNKDDLTVQVAGICLSGEDQKFDLASLVGVLGEAARGVLRIGDEGMDEEQYWRVHPPRNR
jgi:hypothetical protein